MSHRFTLFSALICDCIYSTKTIFTGRLLLESSQRILDKSPGDEDAALAARTLYESAVKHQQHAGSLWALSVWTGAATFWAGRDVLAFRGLTPLELERYVSRMPWRGRVANGSRRRRGDDDRLGSAIPAPNVPSGSRRQHSGAPTGSRCSERRRSAPFRWAPRPPGSSLETSGSSRRRRRADPSAAARPRAVRRGDRPIRMSCSPTKRRNLPYHARLLPTRFPLYEAKPPFPSPSSWTGPVSWGAPE